MTLFHSDSLVVIPEGNLLLSLLSDHSPLITYNCFKGTL